MQRPLTLVSGRWRVERLVGTAAEIHGRSIGADGGAVPTVALCRLTRPAVVLGSVSPRDDQVDVAGAAAGGGLDVVRRRSGGGAVLVDDTVVWADFVLPRQDPRWDDDVGRAMWWVGDVWAAALERAGLAGAGLHVHRGGLVRNRWSSLVCFAGFGPGEVRVGDCKVVGVAQRRTREWALFQTACLLSWNPARLLDVLVLDPAERATAAEDLRRSVTGLAELGGPADRDAVEGFLLAAL